MEEISSTQQKSEERDIPPSSIIEFRNKYYKEITDEQWQDWKWQIKNRIITRKELERFIELNKDEIDAFENNPNINFSITPYYMHLVVQSNAIRKCVIPTIQETIISECESIDPLCEEETNPVKCIVHRYPDRCLFLVSDFCSSRCRYCTRSRIIDNDNKFHSRENWQQAIDYIKQNQQIRDVIISGGDPLTLNNSDLQFILDQLYNIEHINIIRIGTKVITVLPQRIDNELLNTLDLYWQKLFINIHWTHPLEITDYSKEACLKLARLGIPLGSQTVLLSGVNNSVETMNSLMQGLLECKVIPRYLYSMDRIMGSKHFFVPIEKGKEIIKGIQGYTSGMACPKYVIDSSLGKIPVDIGYTEKVDTNIYKLTNYQEKELVYK
jgi:lysine 2,3-aminomutase